MNYDFLFTAYHQLPLVIPAQQSDATVLEVAVVAKSCQT